MDEVFNQHERAEAERFAGVLDTLEAGGQPDVEALVDADLASLLRTADSIREPGLLATESDAFHSYRARSRAYILHTLEQRQRETREPVALRPRTAQPTIKPATEQPAIVSFLARHRRWTLFAPVAAAVAGLVLFTPLAFAPGDDRPSAVANLTNLTAARNAAELDRINQAIAQLTQRATRGEPVDASILRTITESTTAVANRIETQPQSVSKEHVKHYQRTVAQGSTALGAVQAAAGTEDALAAAQRATEDGKLTAARFLGAEPTPTPAAATPVAATSGGTPAATSAAVPSATPAATSTPAATATATPAAASEGAVRP